MGVSEKKRGEDAISAYEERLDRLEKITEKHPEIIIEKKQFAGALQGEEFSKEFMPKTKVATKDSTIEAINNLKQRADARIQAQDTPMQPIFESDEKSMSAGPEEINDAIQKLSSSLAVLNSIKHRNELISKIYGKLREQENALHVKDNELGQLKNHLLKRDEIEKSLNVGIDNLKMQLSDKNSQIQLLRSHFRQADETDTRFKGIIDEQNKVLAEKNFKIEDLSVESMKLKNKCAMLEQANAKLFSQFAQIQREKELISENLASAQEESRQKDAYYPLFMEIGRLDREEEQKDYIKENMDSEIALKAKILELQDIVVRQKNLLMEKDEKLRSAASELHHQSQELYSRVALPAEQIITRGQPKNEAEPKKTNASFASPLIEIAPQPRPMQIIGQKSSEDEMQELIPMIDVAVQHGESIEKLKSSLLRAGYSIDSINKAIQQLK